MSMARRTAWRTRMSSKGSCSMLMPIQAKPVVGRMTTSVFSGGLSLNWAPAPTDTHATSNSPAR